MDLNTDTLTPLEIKNGLNTSYIGQEIVYYEKTVSTNIIAAEYAAGGSPEGTLVIAEEQTGGKGRMGRNWLSPAFKNILMSIIFRPDLKASEVFNLTVLSSVAVVRGIKKVTGINTLIKWPNDIYIHKKKACGILTEINGGDKIIKFAVVGIGLNVNFNPSLIPEISEIATSVSDEKGEEVSRVKLLQSILEFIEEYYDLLKQGKGEQIREEWESYSLVIGKNVSIISFDKTLEGRVESFSEDGSLILVDKKGKRKKILTGDVSLKLNG